MGEVLPGWEYRAQKADQRQQAGAAPLLGEFVRNPLVGAGVHRHPVHGGQVAGHEGSAGDEQVTIVAAPVQQVLDDGAQQLLARLHHHLRGEGGIDDRVLGQEVESFGDQHVVEERAHALLDARRGQHALQFVPQPVRCVQEPALRRIEQGAVRGRIP